MNPTNIPYLDFTWNPMHGCTPIGKGCTNCWAARMATRLAGRGVKGYDKADPFKVVCDESRLDEPLRRKQPTLIGVSFMGDLCHEDVSEVFIGAVLNVVCRCPQHTFVMLTKRPERMQVSMEYWLDTTSHATPPNLWVGTSASTWKHLDRNLPHLLRCPAAVRWLSLEPLLGPLDQPSLGYAGPPTMVDWIVVGCESGPGRRPCELAWIQSVVDQCSIAGVPCYVKQVDWNGKVIVPGDPNWPAWAKQEMPR